jgi:hypothetical protein
MGMINPDISNEPSLLEGFKVPEGRLALDVLKVLVCSIYSDEM